MLPAEGDMLALLTDRSHDPLSGVLPGYDHIVARSRLAEGMTKILKAAASGCLIMPRSFAAPPCDRVREAVAVLAAAEGFAPDPPPLCRAMLSGA